MSDLLFVYGTLRARACNAHATQLRSESQPLGRAWLPGRLYRVSWYPGAVYDATSESQVWGEVVYLPHPAETLRWLDDYEGILDETLEYVRRTLPVCLNGQWQPAEVYCYVAPVAETLRIVGGDFGPYL